MPVGCGNGERAPTANARTFRRQFKPGMLDE